MKRRSLTIPDPGQLGTYLKANIPDSQQSHHGHGGMTSKRVDTYKGHTIEIDTAYTITVDGKPVSAHVQVGDDGHVHTHSLPNYSWRSTLDLVRQMVDMFPDDFPKPKKKKGKTAKQSRKSGTAVKKKTARRKGK